ncbi:glycosyltransferase family protein [Amycolatopsis thermoflava]|uniref:hypothetical protein n=1 Tax=Amycolatopsis thermoflava TaxID=84480 RepID=UPI0036522A53
MEKPTSTWSVNAGVYVLDPDLLDRVPNGEFYPITRIFDDCLDRREPVGLWPIDKGWTDVGRPDELAQARGER